jgi:hypothetical protein
VELQAIEQSTCFGRLAGFVERRLTVSVQVIHHEMDASGIRIIVVKLAADAMIPNHK